MDIAYRYVFREENKMNENTIWGIIILAIYVYGFWRAWKQLTQRQGFLADHLPSKALAWLNQKKAGSVAVKIGVSCILAYIFAAMAIIIAAYTLVVIIFRWVNSIW